MYALRHPANHGFEPEQDDKSTNRVLPVEYRGVCYKAAPIPKHVEVAETDERTLQDDWREQVEISPKYDEYRPQIINMLEEFQSMRDGNLGTIKAAKHRVELTPPNARPIHSVPYRAGLKARTFEKTEIDRLLRTDVIEPAQTGLRR